jgi:hypothetical protein
VVLIAKLLYPAFLLGCRPCFVSPVVNDSLFQEGLDNRWLVFIKQPNDVGDTHPAVEKKVADRDISLRQGIESRNTFRQFKAIRSELKPISGLGQVLRHSRLLECYKSWGRYDSHRKGTEELDLYSLEGWPEILRVLAARFSVAGAPRSARFH